VIGFIPSAITWIVTLEGKAMRDPHFADFILGVLVGFTLGASLTAIAWAFSD
jgi:hypothetical protein